MAIVKTSVYDEDKTVGATKLYNYLLENAVPTYFDSVVYDTETNNGTITCYVGELAFLTISNLYLSGSAGITIKITTENNTTLSLNSYSSNGRMEYAYKCKNGIVFVNDSASNTGFFGICKNNNGETAIIILKYNNYWCYNDSNSTSNKLCAYSTCDDTLIAYNAYKDLSRMTSLCPIPTSSISGRYLKDVYYTPFTEDTALGKALDINGVKYLSTGIFCIKDE